MNNYIVVRDKVSVDGGSSYVDVVSVNVLLLQLLSFSANISAGDPLLRKWQYHDDFKIAPGTSSYVSTRGGSGDEMHVIVVDEDAISQMQQYCIRKVCLCLKGK